MSSSPTPHSLRLLAGKKIAAVRRVWYVLRTDVRDSVGAIEFAFADGSAVVLDAGPDGEALAVSAGRWVDHFAPPLSPENERYVEASGKWTAFDVSDQAPYSDLVGVIVEYVEPHLNPEGKLIGATIHAGTSVVRAEVAGDEIAVDVV